MARELSERFWANVEKTETCWLWRKGRDRDGYGKMEIGTLKNHCTEQVHRVAMLLARIDLEGVEGHHACQNKNCVRLHSDHVCVVPRQHNPDSPSHINRLKTVCKYGHPLIPRGRRRFCRICARKRALDYYHRKRNKLSHQTLPR